MKFPLIAASAISLVAMTAPVLAHSDYDRHDRDHARHRQFHSYADRAHDRAHREGFYSRGEHRAYHRALRYMHRDFHDYHPGTRHDHYRWWR